MILILTSSGDASADFVMDWLNYYDYPVTRINSDVFLNGQLFVSIFPPQIIYCGVEIDLKDVNAVWFWKFGNIKRTDYYQKVKDVMPEDIVYQLLREFHAVANTITSLLKKKYWLTNPKSIALNKLHALNVAYGNGLEVPGSYVLNTKVDLQKLLSKGEYISKSTFEPLYINKAGKGVYSMLTKNITNHDVESFSEAFFPSLVQQKIEKSYEVRIFYLEGQFYSMAIFSQNSDVTKLDFRNVSSSHDQNRLVPYELPETEKTKINNMMIELELNCGSIDMIKGTDGKYYFLEVNPTGQFGMVSYPCNYNLFHVVACHLIKKDKKNERCYAG